MLHDLAVTDDVAKTVGRLNLFLKLHIFTEKTLLADCFFQNNKEFVQVQRLRKVLIDAFFHCFYSILYRAVGCHDNRLHLRSDR